MRCTPELLREQSPCSKPMLKRIAVAYQRGFPRALSFRVTASFDCPGLYRIGTRGTAFERDRAKCTSVWDTLIQKSNTSIEMSLASRVSKLSYMVVFVQD
jgi:hypothetical protein